MRNFALDKLRSLRISHTYALSLALVIAGFLCEDTTAQSISKFHLYYGNEQQEWDQIESSLVEGSLVVIDTRAFSQERLEKWITLVHQKKGQVIGYFSIGELHSHDVQWFKEMVPPAESWESLVIDKNETFQSFRVDVKHQAWSRWVAQETKALLDRGIDGIFLDTVDTIDRYATREDWPLERRVESVRAMFTLIRSIKSAYPDSYLMQNGGLNMTGKRMFIGAARGIETDGQHLAPHRNDNPDGILWENAFSGQDDWTLGRQAILEEIQEAGFTQVFALGYQKAHPKASIFFQKCRKSGFVGAWGNSSLVLHEEATLTEEETHRTGDANGN